LTNLLLVNAGDDDFRRCRHGKGDALGCGIDHFVAETERELDVLALQCSAITNALNGQLLFETSAHPGDHVLDQRAGGAPGSTSFTGVVSRGDDNAIRTLLNIDDIHEREAQFALRALGGDDTTIDRDRNAINRGHRFLAST